MPDIDLDFPRDIREKLIVARHRALRPRARSARRDLRDLPQRAARSATSARRSGSRSPSSSGSRSVTDGWNATARRRRAAALPERAHSSRPRWQRVPRADPRDRRPAAPHLPASGRDGHLDAAADRPRPRPAGGDGGPADLPVGQGLLRRRRLPEDRPARARDALRGRGVRRPDRPAPRRADRPLAHPARRSRRLRGDPGGRHRRLLPDREPRADAEPPAHPAREPRRPHRPGRARAAGADPGQGRAPVHRAAAEAARRPGFEPPVEHIAAQEPLRETLGVVVFQDQVLDVAMAISPASASARRRAAPRDEPQARARGARGVPARASSRAALGNGDRRDDCAHRSTTSSSASPASASRSRTRPRSACSRTNRRGCATTTAAEFLCALLNAQPMGFYPPASLVRDAQRRGVEVRPPHVNRSARQCTVEDGRRPVGLGYIRSVGEDEAAARRRRAAVRDRRRSRAPRRCRRTRSKRSSPRAPATSGAPRRELLWQPRASRRAGETVTGGSEQLALPIEPTVGDSRAAGARPTGSGCSPTTATRSISVGMHPLQLLRPHLAAACVPSDELRERAPRRPGRRSPALAVARQRPSTAKGVVFMLLEDEHGQMNLIIPPPVYEAPPRDRARRAAAPRPRPLRARRTATRTSSSTSSSRLGPLARSAANDAEVRANLPGAHHFGHR